MSNIFRKGNRVRINGKAVTGGVEFIGKTGIIIEELSPKTVISLEPPKPPSPGRTLRYFVVKIDDTDAKITFADDVLIRIY